jgi:hypothetical protein
MTVIQFAQGAFPDLFIVYHFLRSEPLMKLKTILLACAPLVAVLTGPLTQAAVIDVTIKGSDAIFLAGRTDLIIPNADQPWTGPGDYLTRHGGPTPEEIKETVPPIFSIVGGDIIRALDPAAGGISFFNGVGDPFYGPSGNGLSGSSLSSLGGISGYIGPQGALTGVFLTDAIPSSTPPGTLDFSPGGIGIDFLALAPGIGQVFYIGDGKTSLNVFQTFLAPVGATRFALGIPDGFGFNGPAGAYDDNDGSYRIRIGINDVPTTDPHSVPEPSNLALLLIGLVGIWAGRRRRS